jgi:cytoskeletal protein CcmA (bactofilin family)
MGIKENFTQAVKELTGAGKDQSAGKDQPKSSQVEDLRRAVEAEAVEKPETTATTEAVTEEIPAPTSYEPQEPVMFAPKGSHAGLDMNIQELHETAAPQNGNGSQYFSAPAFNTGALSEPSPISSPFGGQTLSPVQSFPRSEPFPISSPFAQNGNGYNNAMAEAMGEVPSAEEELTVISKNTVIEGNIRSFANMNIDGNIRGDIETTKNVDLNGKVIGNLTCNNAQMLTSQIQGNIRMKGNVLMGRDTLLIGDLVSTYAKVNGKVKGNLEIGGKAELKSDAVIFGDISASTITVDDGAIIQGYVSTTFLNKEESRNIFPETISIAE